MATVLSQDEIDALLSKVADSEPPPQHKEAAPQAPSGSNKKATSYDFRHPNRVSKDQLRTLESLHDNFASQFGSSLSGFTRSVVDIDLLSVDQITYSEFIMSLASPSCTYVFNMNPLEGAAVADFSPAVVFSFVDRIFGGRGKTLSADRELTGIEKSIMGKIVDKAFLSLGKAWDHVYKMEFHQTAFETNPQFMQVIPPGETVIVVSLQVKMQASTGVLTLCYPYLGLEPIMEKLSVQNWIDANKKGTDNNLFANNTKQILPVKIGLRAILGATNVSIRELLEVKEGDVIRLDVFENDNVNILVGTQSKYLGKPGCIGSQKAVQITQSLE
jgi:flagellar motor switch protein FliM